ncbi:MAG: YqaA family protein [Methyloligella sp. ZOD6]
MLRRLYDRIIELAATPYAFIVLGAVSFAESSFFPIPPDVVLVPMVLAEPAKARMYALWCTITSVAGGLVGYAIGALLWDTVGAWLIQAYGYGDSFETFRAAYAEWGAWIILIKGLTPIPYKLVTIASGFAGYDIWAFIVLSLITRGARFFLEAELLRYFGEPIRDFIEKRLTLVTTGFLLAVVGGVLLARYVF